MVIPLGRPGRWPDFFRAISGLSLSAKHSGGLSQPIRLLFVGVVLTLLAACGRNAPETVDFQVYKNPECGCCRLWVDHMRSAGFTLSVQTHHELSQFKHTLGVGERNHSCHTTVATEGGYFFEGHIPSKVIKRFLADPPPEALGLAVPAMPMGSPGMERGEMFRPYEVYLIKADGEREVYAEFVEREDQYEEGQPIPAG